MKKPSVKLKENEKFNLMTTIKTNMKNIIKNNTLSNGNTIHETMNEIVIRTNKIVIHTYQFLKLYLLYLYDNNIDFPVIDEYFIRIVMKIVSKRNCGSGRQPKKETLELMTKLEDFYKKHYNPSYKNIIVSDDKLGYILSYEAIDIVKNIKNNVSEHFIDYVNKFVNCSFNVKEKIQKINNQKLSKNEKKEKRTKFYTEIREVKQ